MENGLIQKTTTRLVEMLQSMLNKRYQRVSGQINIWEWDGPSREWIVEDILKNYENYVRTNPFLMSSLHELEDKQLGCW